MSFFSVFTFDQERRIGDTAFQAPVNALNAKISSLREQLGYQMSHDAMSVLEGSELSHVSVSSPSTSANGCPESIRFGSRALPFPAEPEYSSYLDIIFEDINVCHPCINEADFRSKSQRLLATRRVDLPDACFLALNYILFACADILTNLNPVQGKPQLPGWRWFLASDELMARRKISGRGDLGLIQFLVYEV